MGKGAFGVFEGLAGLAHQRPTELDHFRPPIAWVMPNNLNLIHELGHLFGGGHSMEQTLQGAQYVNNTETLRGEH